jgi:hypothetical protein
MLFGGQILTYSEISIKRMNIFCGQNAEFGMFKQVVHVVTAGFKALNITEAIGKAQRNHNTIRPTSPK